jgi:hypothetical protein
MREKGYIIWLVIGYRKDIRSDAVLHPFLWPDHLPLHPRGVIATPKKKPIRKCVFHGLELEESESSRQQLNCVKRKGREENRSAICFPLWMEGQ